ncbi:MAG: HAD-IIIA family hydrolase, partial [Patescibacteria group bacterium]
MKKIAFLDRDGTLIYEPEETKQIDSLEKLKILPGVITGLKKLTKQGYKLVMISNQDGLETKSFPKKDFDKPQNEMLKIFKKNGIEFYKIFI